MTQHKTPLKIYFEDQHLAVLSKPAGMLSQGDESGDVSLVDVLRDHFGRNYVGLVHRLDRNTSGLMVVAKRTKAARRLTEALKEGELKRRYLAWLFGKLSSESRWCHWILKNEHLNKVMVVSKGSSGAKESSLKVKPIETASVEDRFITLAELELETGRGHQIRVQALAQGHPVLGDRKYFTKESAFFDRMLSRSALHSSYISFPHPMNGNVLVYEEDLPSDLQLSI